MSGRAPIGPQDPLTPAVLRWGGFGTVLQVVVSAAGHFDDRIYSAWPVPTLVVAAATAVVYTIQVRRSLGDSAWHGGMVAAICTFLGTALATVLADVPAIDLAVVTSVGAGLGAVTGSIAYVLLSQVSRARSV